jgi:HSP20 family protein
MREEEQAMANLGPFAFLGGDPFRELRRLQEEMSRLASALPTAAGSMAGAGFPAVNIYARRDGIAIMAELPGVEAADLEIQARQDALTIAGTRHPVAEQPEAYHRRERRSGAFSRTIQLPFRIDPERIDAHLENGVLRLSLQRPEEDKPRRIEIRG